MALQIKMDQDDGMIEMVDAGEGNWKHIKNDETQNAGVDVFVGFNGENTVVISTSFLSDFSVDVLVTHKMVDCWIQVRQQRVPSEKLPETVINQFLKDLGAA